MNYIKNIIFLFCWAQSIQSSPISVPNGGTGRSTITAYNLICGGTTSTGALQITSPSTSGRYLLSNGAGALPTFQTVSSSTTSSITLLQTQTASSSSSLVFTIPISGFNATNGYIIIFTSIVPSTSAVFNMDFSTDGGSTYLSTGYLSGYNSHAYNSATLSNTNSTSTCPLGGSNSTCFSGYIMINGTALGSGFQYTGQAMYDTSGTFVDLFGTNSAFSSPDRIKFSMSSGNITSGTITIYTIKES